MNIIGQPVQLAWQFNPSGDNSSQPPFVSVSAAMGGPRAIARPPATKLDPYPVTFYLTSTDWLVQLENGQYIQISDHTAVYLLGRNDDDGDKA